ncbi:acetolactate synthase large subunit [Aestuariivita sp.]|jgi:acetolactate synthase-1/2/3 large subunit|uniref:acetolactate synthase large subunit n=1 Tax=Aestuariivita sp. TaxID=1872407 RepID=UPI0025BC9FBC|nr:acetolactate synthase large subunit [Aestuariivita sp.]
MKDHPTSSQDHGTPAMNGAESVVRSLHAAGCEVCFANPGTSEMQFVDALDRTGLLRCVLALFEGVATGAADGYARMAKAPAVTLLHLAPGLANGGANMHNARKGRVPMVNLVGDHAVRHRGFDAPLTADVEAAARPFSDWVRTASSPATFAADAMDALAAAQSRPNKVATLIAPADLGWDAGGVVAPPPETAAFAPLDATAVEAAAGKLGPDTLLLIGGTALETPDAVAQAQGIAKQTGATVLAPTSNRRFDRGAGRAGLAKVPYPINMALEVLARFRHAILVEALPPVAFFAYPERPSLLLPATCDVLSLTGLDGDGPAAIAALAEHLGAAPHLPRAVLPPPPQAGAIRPDTIAAAIANALPERAIVVDESISGGRDIWAATQGAAPHSWISLTGGAIGDGIPMALGAAVACPDRPVLALQADGSAMYTIQGLWSQAREGANVTTLIFANRTYQILKTELFAVGANPGRSALDMLDLDRPTIDFVDLAKGMGVPGRRVECVADLQLALVAAMETPGPYLIEAIM